MTIDQEQFELVCTHARQAIVFQTSADTFEWDQQTYLPSAAGDYRARQVSALRGHAHRLRTDPEHGDRIDELYAAAADQMDQLDVDVAATIRELHRDYHRDRKVPADLVESVSMATVHGHQAWEQAREADDFDQFHEPLQRIIELKREVGQAIAEGTDWSTYEALMDEYEPGAKVAQVLDVFDQLRTPLVALIKRITESPLQPDVSILRRDFEVDSQRAFSKRVSEAIGFDFSRGRLDETAHPFCTTLGTDDIRILTRFDKNWLPGGLFGTMHEAGHGMYEQGLRREWFGLAPGSYLSLGFHESQSRLWENQVGRSRAFWNWLYPQAQQTFSPALDDVAGDDFYFAINQIKPSLIRVEADEATYNLHIILRFDLERELIEDELAVEDLPEAWNDRYESDLGIKPPSAANGVLQDVHWSAGLFGYFPTYTLGNLISAQLFDAAKAELGDLDNLFRKGEFSPLLDWLRTHVHEPGRRHSAAELVRSVCGQALSPQPLVDYLTDKLIPLYNA